MYTHILINTNTTNNDNNYANSIKHKAGPIWSRREVSASALSSRIVVK